MALGPDSFDDALDRAPVSLVEFTGGARWEALDTLVGRTLEPHAGVLLGRVDCVTHKDLCSDLLGMSPRPERPELMLFFRDTMEGALYASDAPLDIDAVLAWLQGGYREQLARDAAELAAPSASKDEGGKMSFGAAVTALTDAAFDTHVLPGTTWVVDMYAPWCGHCRDLAPVWASVAAAAATAHPAVHFGSVDVDQHGATATRFNVEGLPTIVAIRNGRYWTFEAERTHAALLDWVAHLAELKDSDGLPVPPLGELSPGPEDAAASGPVEDKHSVVLTDANFDTTVTREHSWLIEVYAPWCGHCKALAPIWAMAAERAARDEAATVRFGTVDGDAQAATAMRFGVDGFPTVLLVTREGQVYDYGGPRSAPALVDFAAQRGAWQKHGTLKGPLPAPVEVPPPFSWSALVDPDTVALTDASWKEQLANESTTWMVECYAEWCGHCQALAPQWAAAATRAREEGVPALRWAKAELETTRTLHAQLGVQGFPTVVKVRGSRYVEYSGDRTTEALLAWAKQEPEASAWVAMGSVAVPPPPPPADAHDDADSEEDVSSVKAEAGDVISLTDSSFETLVAGERDPEVTWMVDMFAEWCGHCKKLAPQWAVAATAARQLGLGKVRWAKLDVDAAPATSDRYRVEGLPTILAVRGARHWAFEGARTAGALVAWARGARWTDAAAQRLDAPAGAGSSADQSAVTVLTDANWDATMVATAEAPWMVEFFAPWCGHCKKLQPQWAEAALMSPGHVRWGKVDTDANPALADRFKIEGLPTILRFSGGGKPESYEGARTATALVEFADKKPAPAKKAPAAAVSDLSLVLTDANFDRLLDASQTWLVAFTAPWCGHCQELAPVWAAASHSLSGARLAKVDTDASPGLVDRYNISGLPTVLLLSPTGPVHKHKGTRDAASFQRFVSSAGATDGLVWLDPAPARTPLPGAYDDTHLTPLVDDAARRLLGTGTWVVAITKDRDCRDCSVLMPRVATLAAAVAAAGVRVGVATAPRDMLVAAAWGVRQFPALFLVQGTTRWPLAWETYTDDDLRSMVVDGLDPREGVPVEWMGMASEAEAREDAPAPAAPSRLAALLHADVLLRVAVAVLAVAVVALALAYRSATAKLAKKARPKGPPQPPAAGNKAAQTKKNE